MCNLWYCLLRLPTQQESIYPQVQNSQAEQSEEDFQKQTTLQIAVNSALKWIKCVWTHLYGNELIASEPGQQEVCDNFKFCTNHKRKSGWANSLSKTTGSGRVMNYKACRGTLLQILFNSHLIYNGAEHDTTTMSLMSCSYVLMVSLETEFSAHSQNLISILQNSS